MDIKVTDISKYNPKSSDIFLFDNTVWMYIFCPLGNYNIKKQKCYSSFLNTVGSSNSTIFITSLILSEFTNRYLRLDFDLWKEETRSYSANFKSDFIGTERYKETVEAICASLNNIMRLCEKTSDNFNAINLLNVLKHFEAIDFNDSYYIELATLGKYKIVTDDSDFILYQNHGVEIITMP